MIESLGKSSCDRSINLKPSAFAVDPDDLHKLKDTGDCVQCDLKDANLVRANLKGADLSYSNLEGAILKDAWLEGANCR